MCRVDAARAHPRVLHVHAAERDDELGVLEDRLPRGRAPQHLVGAADDVRQDHLGRAERVAVDRRGVAADAVQEAVQLALRVVEPAGARPAVRAAVDRLVAVLGAHPSAARRRPGRAPRPTRPRRTRRRRADRRDRGRARASRAAPRAACTRASLRMPSTKFASSGDGAGIVGMAVDRDDRRRPSTVTRNAPQCDMCGSVRLPSISVIAAPPVGSENPTPRTDSGRHDLRRTEPGLSQSSAGAYAPAGSHMSTVIGHATTSSTRSCAA